MATTSLVFLAHSKKAGVPSWDISIPGDPATVEGGEVSLPLLMQHCCLLVYGTLSMLGSHTWISAGPGQRPELKEPPEHATDVAWHTPFPTEQVATQH